ncbi:MAG TPA: acyl-CoA dehydrogenase, partial [Rhodobiaceae bacterium]|nr:acyl-CoA dehydrogenase [Rhodobiaceae bacterium]
LNEVAGLDGLMGAGPFADLSADLVESVMEEGAKLAADVLAPLNRSGDAEGVKLNNQDVSVPSGFADAYRKWVEGGWG